MPDEMVLRMIFGTPIRPGGRTLGQILSRKVARRTLKESLGISGTPDTSGHKKRKKRADVEEPNAVLAKMALLNAIAKAASIEKEAPFKSEAQRRKFYAMASRGEISKTKVKEWESHTPKGKKLPERVHRKAADLDKEAFWAGLGRAVAAPFIGAGKALKGATGFGLKSMFWPTKARHMVGSVGISAGVAGAGAARQPGPSGMMPMQPRLAAVADRLIELTKESFEFRTYSPASTDVAEPIVKKNSMSKSSAAAGPSLGTAAFRPTPVSTSVRSSSTVNPGADWLRKSTPIGSKWSKPERPATRKPSGMAPEEKAPAAEAGTHIQRPSV